MKDIVPRMLYTNVLLDLNPGNGSQQAFKWHGNSMKIIHNVKKRFMKVSKTSFTMETLSLIFSFDYICQLTNYL